MKKLKYVIIGLIVFAGIIAILMHNKQKLEAKAKNTTIEAYPVTVENAAIKPVTRTLSLVGTITANNDVAIVSESTGKVTKVLAEVGDYKKAGSILFQLDDELKSAAYKTAEANYEKAKKDYERFEVLNKEHSVTDAQFENAKLGYQSAEAQYIVAKRQYEDTKITTPISGIVTARNVNIGNYVSMGKIVANVVDISKLKVELNLAEKDAFHLKPGDKAKITTDVYPGIKFNGKIDNISAKADAAHTYPVEISLSNSKEHPLKAGMFARVTFVSATEGKALVIPREALLGSIKEPQVFVVNNGLAKLKNVVIGSEYDNLLEVKEGISEGEQVVTNGQNNLKDGYKISVTR